MFYVSYFQYDPRFADAFWNSSKVNFVTHILLMLTSWALVCDVWYLPPETQQVSKKYNSLDIGR